MPMDDECGCAIRAGFDREGECQESGESPLPRGSADQHSDPGEDRQDDAARHDRADE
jgi:hypothetical protein